MNKYKLWRNEILGTYFALFCSMLLTVNKARYLQVISYMFLTILELKITKMETNALKRISDEDGSRRLYVFYDLKWKEDCAAVGIKISEPIMLFCAGVLFTISDFLFAQKIKAALLPLVKPYTLLLTIFVVLTVIVVIAFIIIVSKKVYSVYRANLPQNQT